MINKVVQFRRELKINELPDDLTTILNCSKIAHCSHQHIRNLINKGKLRGYSLGCTKVSVNEALRAMGV